MTRRRYVTRVCSFGEIEIGSRKPTYAELKAAVLERGKFSAFEATQNERACRMFDRLERDPELETLRDPPGFPWVGVRAKVDR